MLQVICSSPGELEPVFQAMLENATRICEAKFGVLWLCEGDAFPRRWPCTTARRRLPRRGERDPLIRPDPAHAAWPRRRDQSRCVHIADITAGAGLHRAAIRPFVPAVELGGARTLLVVPMLKENELVGAIAIYRQEVRPFTDKQIELVTELRRPGRHRHREHAPAQRAARIAAAADRHRRRAQGHQPLDLRSAGGARYAGRIGGAAVRSG